MVAPGKASLRATPGVNCKKYLPHFPAKPGERRRAYRFSFFRPGFFMDAQTDIVHDFLHGCSIPFIDARRIFFAFLLAVLLFGCRTHKEDVGTSGTALESLDRINVQPNTDNAEWTPLARAIFEHDAAAVAPAVAAGEDPNAQYASMYLVELAAYHGQADVLEALIHAGAKVPATALRVLGEMDITDWLIDPIELEKEYARVAQLLLDHGASPDVLAHDGRPLIETFPAHHYPHIHRVLSQRGGHDKEKF